MDGAAAARRPAGDFAEGHLFGEAQLEGVRGGLLASKTALARLVKMEGPEYLPQVPLAWALKNLDR